MAFLLDYEGDGDDEEWLELDDNLDGPESVVYLCDMAFRHRVDGELRETTECTESAPASQFMLDKYSAEEFQGILPDTGAAARSTAGKAQFLALRRQDASVGLDVSEAGAATIRFGIGDSLSSLGSTRVTTPFGVVKFHVMDSQTPFLLCLGDMDRLGVYLDNTRNELVSESLRVPIVRKWGHPWLLLGRAAATAFLTEAEMRRLHCRFGHPSIGKLQKLLTNAGHDVEQSALAEINKFCHHCQMKNSSPRRFKFSLKSERDFNFEVIVDVLHLDGKPVLHVVDSGTSFQAGRFLKSMSAKDTWDALRLCWIDTYLGPPDVLTHDAGTNFASVEFKAEAKLLGITCHQVPVEAHWSIGKVERYHAPLRRAFDIFRAELGDAPSESVLQMALKAVNDTAGPDGLVPTLLVFGAFPRITIDSPPTPSSIKRAQAIAKAMGDLRKWSAKRRVQDALNTRNGPDTSCVLPLSLPIGSEVRVWREDGGWKGPYAVLSVTESSVMVATDNGAVEFRATHVQPYHRHPDGVTVDGSEEQATNVEGADHSTGERNPQPAGNTNLAPPFEYPAPPAPRRRGRPRKVQLQHVFEAFISPKERASFELATRLRAEGKITTPGAPFEASDASEIDALITSSVIVPVQWDARSHGTARVFKSRMVREIKGASSDTPYEKSRLVVQGFGDDAKRQLLTQSPTIQRCSQRIIVHMAASLRDKGMQLALRDITMAYTQAESKLQRLIIAQLPVELQEKYPEGTVLHVVKPLYGIAESGVHWFETYHRHHEERLGMQSSPFDPCLLITRPKNHFGIVGLQTDDTLNLGSAGFLDREEHELKHAGYKAKPRQVLADGDTGEFNGCRLQVAMDGIMVAQKGQSDKLIAVDSKATDAGQQYVVQRARGAYIASICQPEAAFDYSTAAQAQKPSPDDIGKLNMRINWQLANKSRGLRFVPVDLATAKVMVFTDGSFANNKDLTSQIGFVIAVVNERVNGDSDFEIRGNILHWSSTKCKRVTRSVLASEIYGLTSGFDYGFVLAHTLRTICERLDHDQSHHKSVGMLPLVVCTDSYSLYECLVKLGSTTEKRLMIDIMGLR